LDLNNDLPPIREELSAMPTATTDWLVESFRQPNAALLATIGPQVCAATGPRCDPRDPQGFATAWARRLQLTTYFPHQVSYGQHATPQISWSGSRQRNAIACRRRNRLRIKKAVVWHRELRFDHLPDQLVFIVQELHHFERGWGGGLSPRRCCHALAVSADPWQVVPCKPERRPDT
jgi:hypothetical protein